MAIVKRKLTYRARIFSNGLYVMSITAPERGQRFIRGVIHSPNFGLFGEKTVLAFMINRKIKPKIFEGYIMEIDFDISDACQLGDLLEVCPELVHELNPNYRKYLSVKKEMATIDAQYTVLKEESEKSKEAIDHLCEDPKPEEKPADPKPEEDPEEERPIDKIMRDSRTAFEIARTAAPFLPGIRNLTSPEKEPDEKIKKIIEVCNKSPAHRKLLYWIPEYLGLDEEIHWIVSQSRPVRCGVDPSYYKAQSGAMIAEKVLTRPKEPEGWQTVAIIAVIVIGFILGLALILHGGF